MLTPPQSKNRSTALDEAAFNSPPKNTTELAHKLNTRELIAWCFGKFGSALVGRGVGDVMRPVFNTGFGIDAVWLSWALTIPILVGCVVDPLFAHFSDNVHTRWGRRRPFIFAGAFAMAAVTVGMWWIGPEWSVNAKLIVLVIVCTLFGLANTLFNLPLDALGYELTDDYHERSKMNAVLIFFTVTAAMLTTWVYWLALRPIFGGEIWGMRWIACCLGLVILVTGMGPVFFCRERFQNINKDALPFFTSIRTTLSNRVFRHLIYIKIFMVFGTSIFGGMLFYINTYYICDGDKSKAMFITGLGGTLYTITAIAQLPFINWISRKLGKATGMKLGLGILLVTTLLQPCVQNPHFPYLQIVTTILCAPAFTLALIFIGAFMPDICDIDEAATGRRREGTFGAVSGFIDKLEWGVISLLVGYLTAYAGFNQLMPHQPPEVILKLRYCGYIPNFLFTLVAFILACRFPVTEQMMSEVRATLNARRDESQMTPISATARSFSKSDILD